jgi:hypothetical protein
MKSLLATMLLVFLVSSVKADQAPQNCYSQVVRQLNSFGPASDYAYRFRGGLEWLLADEPVVSFWGEELQRFEQDYLTLAFAGSYHSGWFEELAIVEPVTCKLVTTINLYSE